MPTNCKGANLSALLFLNFPWLLCPFYVLQGYAIKELLFKILFFIHEITETIGTVLRNILLAHSVESYLAIPIASDFLSSYLLEWNVFFYDGLGCKSLQENQFYLPSTERYYLLHTQVLRISIIHKWHNPMCFHFLSVQKYLWCLWDKEGCDLPIPSRAKVTDRNLHAQQSRAKFLDTASIRN